jgi:hypothetical protein
MAARRGRLRQCSLGAGAALVSAAARTDLRSPVSTRSSTMPCCHARSRFASMAASASSPD